jgi:FkbM family methyltransferase
MSVSARLNLLLNPPQLRFLIPFVNVIITILKRGVWTRTKWNATTSRFELYQNGRLIHVDVFPYFGCTYQRLRENVLRVNLDSIEIKSGGTVVDIGAGTGTESLVFSADVGKQGKVFAIEAHPDTFFSLNELVSKGEYCNIFPFQLALGSSKGRAFINNQKNHETNSVSFQSSIGIPGIEVQMTTLDDFVQLNNIERIDFLKVNIEGAERFILRGMQNSIHCIQSAAISCHDFLNDDKEMTITNEVRFFFEEHGFKVWQNSHSHPVLNSWLYMIRV